MSEIYTEIYIILMENEVKEIIKTLEEELEKKQLPEETKALYENLEDKDLAKRLNFYKLRLRIVQRDLGRYPFENNHACWDWFPNGYENNKKNEKKDNIYLEEIKCLTNKQKTIIQNLEKIDNNNITKMNNLIKELYRNEAIAKIEYLKKEIDNIEEKIERHEQYKLRYRR